jgi:hypothetical protein
VSLDTLVRPKIHWDESAKASLASDEKWFEEFDEILEKVDPATSLSVYEGPETWYVINDSDVTYLPDPSPSFGLDTWDF